MTYVILAVVLLLRENKRQRVALLEIARMAASGKPEYLREVALAALANRKQNPERWIR